MASPNVLTFDAEGGAVDFEVWVDDLQLFLQCDSKDGVSLFDHTFGVAVAPAADANSTVRSQWTTRDAAARLAVCSHLPTAERAHFSQCKTTRTLYDAVVACYSSSAIAALSGLMLLYLFLDLAAFATVADLITHLHTSDTHYRTALPAEDHFLSLCPTTLTVDLLEECLLAAETSIVAVGASCGDPRAPFFEGCSPVPLLPSVASAAAVGLSAAPGAGEAALSGTASTQVLHTFTLDSGASRSFFRDCTTLSPLSRPVAVSLADPSVGPVLAHTSMVLPCPAVPSGSLSGLHLPLFSTNLVSGADLHDAWVAASGQVFAAASRSGPEHGLPCPCHWGRAIGAGGATRAGGPAAAGAAGGSGATSPGGARTRGTGAAGPGGAAGAGAAGGAGAGGTTGPGSTEGAGPVGGAAGAGAPWGAGVGATGAAGGAGGVGGASGVGDLTLGMLVLGLPPSTGPAPSLECPQPVQSESLLQPASPLPAPSPYTGPTGGLTERLSSSCPWHTPDGSTSFHCSAAFPLPSPPESSLPALADLESDSLCAAGPTVTSLLATVVIDPSFESTAASALVTELVDFAAHCRLDYAARLVVASASVCPPSVGEAIEGPYSSQWQAAMDAEMASWKSTGTYVDEVPPPGANIVSGMWILRVKDELHSLDFNTAFLHSSLHEEIWVHRPPSFTGLFPPGTQWSLRRPVYGLRQAPREWHDTLRTTLAALGFAPATADPSLFLRTDTTLPPFYIIVYVDDLVFATADTAGLAHVKSELPKRHMCTDLGELTRYLGLHITQVIAHRTITLTQSHMVQQVLQRFNFTYSSPHATPLSTRHSLSALPSDESVEPSGPYPELVGCPMYLMTCTRPDLAYPLSILARYVAPGRHRPEHMDAAKRVLCYLCSTSGMGLVLGGRARVVLTGHADASWVDDLATQRSSQGYTFSLGSGSVSWRSNGSSSVLSSSCEAEIYAGAMAAQELCWLTYLLTDLGEVPCSPRVLYVDNKAMLALCQEHRTKHIALRYFLARELQQRG
ncbi:unnamed protein product [Closterium sp. NIES-53]